MSIQPSYVLAAFTNLQPELPDLLGSDVWSRIRDEFQVRFETLISGHDDIQQLQAAIQLIELIKPYGNARERLQQELDATAALHTFISAKIIDPTAAALLEAILPAIQLNDAEANTETLRHITLHEGGLGGSKSLKASNLRVDFSQAAEIVAGAIIAGADIIDKPRALIIIGSVLLTISALTKAVTVTVSEQDTSVFWGLIQARGKDNVVSEQKAFTITNRERAKFGLGKLTRRAFTKSLQALRQLKTIEPLPDQHWLLVENYKITRG
ncbi:MAG: hypothetical protein ABI700_02600 [Chloroflexota bacterium]